jgi:hypothetical protein
MAAMLRPADGLILPSGEAVIDASLHDCDARILKLLAIENPFNENQIDW